MEPHAAVDGPRDPLTLRAPRSLLDALGPVREGKDHLTGTLVRPDDQLRITFELVNGRLDPVDNTIVALMDEEPIWFVIAFGAQHVVEGTVPAGQVPPVDPQPQRVAAPTRVSLAVPTGTPYTVATLLDLAAFALHLDPRADGGEGKEEPGPEVTAIEVPASLVLSPTADGGGTGATPVGRFVAATTPVTHGDVTELWRARLGVAVPAGEEGDRGDEAAASAVVEPPAATPMVRAIWSRDGDPPFDRPLDQRQRDLVVKQSTGTEGEPMAVRRLWLTSQGASVDLDGTWAAGVLASYRHRIVTGRDIRVEVAERGYLAPFGHRASVTTLTERAIDVDGDGRPTAVLRQDSFLAITGSRVTSPHDYMPFDGRGSPFTAITATDPGAGPVGQEPLELPDGTVIDPTDAHLLTRDGADLLVSYTATDRNGTDGITFTLPAVFVAEGVAYQTADGAGGPPSVLSRLASWYAASAGADRRDLLMDGQAVAWADPSDRGRSGSVQVTNRIRLALDRPDLGGADPADAEQRLRDRGRPAFYPRVEQAWVVDQASATAMGGDGPEVPVRPAQRWLEHGTGNGNIDLGYLDVDAGEPVTVTPTTQATGMISTGLAVETFGQRLGAGIALPEGGAVWDPVRALRGLPRLLGNLALAQLVGEVDAAADLLSDRGLPTMRVDADLGPPPGVCFRFTWEPELRSFPPDAERKTFVVTADLEGQDLPDEDQLFAGGDTRALLALTSCLPAGTTTFEATLERFVLQVPPFVPAVAVAFDKVRFRTVDGSSSVDPQIADWFFIGPLNWLEPVKDLLLEGLGLGAPTFDGGIFLDVNAPAPGLSLGVLTVDGLTVDLGLALPDVGATSIGFALSSREDPFTITIMGYGGTGSFGVEIDATRIVLIEGSLAVTYELAVDVFIANASLSVSLGVFVVYEDGTVVLGAYAELRGSLSVLGLLELTGTVLLALSYNIGTKVLRGVAAVTGEVACPFGKSQVTHDVEVEVALGEGGQRALAAGGRWALDLASATAGATAAAAPAGVELSFRDRMSRRDWTAYCNAFAA